MPPTRADRTLARRPPAAEPGASPAFLAAAAAASGSLTVSACGYAAAGDATPLAPMLYQLTAADDEVIVEVECCGVCGSDVHMIDHDWDFLEYPLIAGHELVGTVTHTGQHAPATLAVGTRVGVGHISRTCGTCRYCLDGNDEICESITPTAQNPHTGGFGSHVVAQVLTNSILT
jgi:uncharacterized zinc-type alcohol dehydrogenase-like protein